MSRAALLFAGFLLFAALVLVRGRPAEEKPQPSKPEWFTGKVVPLAEQLKKSGIELDAEAAPHWLALAADDGKTYPLIKDAAARPLFRDARLLNRPMRLQGRFAPGSQLLQILQLQSMKDGTPHEVFYWCDVCSIKRPSLEKVCECCGGPMELREVLAK